MGKTEEGCGEENVESTLRTGVRDKPKPCTMLTEGLTKDGKMLLNIFLVKYSGSVF